MTRSRLRDRIAPSAAYPYLVVAALALLWGGLGRLVLDAWLGFLRFGTVPGSGNILDFTIGPLPVWSALAVILWTPWTALLRRRSVLVSLLLGALVVVEGTLLLYVLFVLRTGIPGSAEEMRGALLFSPLFVLTALAMGGMFAVPISLATAVLFRGILRTVEPPRS